MPLRPEIWESDALRNLADQGPVKDPGIYLIALRAHVSRGRKMVGDFVDSMAEGLPQAARFSPAEDDSG